MNGQHRTVPAKKRGKEPTPSTPRLETILLSDVVPHPDQILSDRNLTPFEWEALRADIEANGIKHPPEVMPRGNAAGLPAYSLIVGHNRCDIWKKLGHTTIRVRVRYDLMDATAAAVKLIFLRDNGARRQLTRFDQARYVVELYNVEREAAGKDTISDPLSREDLRDQVGEIIGISGRTLLRYASVLGAPVEVQDAFQAKRVKLVDAARVANLPEKEQRQLAARLRAGEDAGAVFAEYFPPRGDRHVEPADAVAAFARSLAAAQADLADRVGEVRPAQVKRHADALRTGTNLIRSLLGRLDGAA